MTRRYSEADLTVMTKRVGSGGMVYANLGGHPAEYHKRSLSPVQIRPLHPFRSKWEVHFEAKLFLEKRCLLIKDYAYEPFTLKLATGKRKTIDFLIWHQDGSIELAEVKGHHPNIRASLTALSWAAQKNPWFNFTIYRWTGKEWERSDVMVEASERSV